jgi:hypothetical protein
MTERQYAIKVPGQEKDQYVTYAGTSSMGGISWRFDPSTDLAHATRFDSVEDALQIAHRLFWCGLPERYWSVVDYDTDEEVAWCEQGRGAR